MSILYTNVPPLRTDKKQDNFREIFNEYIRHADSVEIGVGYVSQDSLEKLNEYVSENNIRHIKLIVGMYFIEGMPENIYNTLLTMDREWHTQGIGGIEVVCTFRYHAKCYLFSRDGRPFAGIIGSANLGAISLNAQTRRQYELAVSLNDSDSLKELATHLTNLQKLCCKPINDIKDKIHLNRQENLKLKNVEHVQRINSDEIAAYSSHLTGPTFEIPLKVPKDHNDQKFRGSNINVCYAKGRKREWWETEIVTGKRLNTLPGYPKFKQPFMVITDDGWKFEAWTCGTNNKNFYSKDDLKIMGYWLKGRLVAAGLVKPIDHVENDKEFKGLITEKMLKQYGKTTLSLTKTNQKTKNENGDVLDVWLLSFLPQPLKED
jgi:hypothetical protein